MKIIFVTRESYDLAGARIRCYNFANFLKKYKVTTKVLSYADDLGAESGKKEKGLSFIDKLKYNIKALKLLLKEKNSMLYLNRFNYHSLAPILLKILKRNKLILDLDDWELKENPKYHFGIWPTSKAEFLLNKVARLADCCIGASKFLTYYLSQYNEKSYYIPSGVDSSKFRRNKEKKEGGNIIFSWVGTMHRRSDIKNIHFVIECFNELHKNYDNIVLEIVGDGIYKDCLKIPEGNEKIILKNWIPPSEIPAYLRNIDIGLLPLVEDTKFNRSKSPVKLFEYMAMAKPTVSSYIGEPARIIEDGKNGFLAYSKKEFIKKMDMLVNTKKIRKEMGKNAIKTVEGEYSLEKISKKLYNILYSLNNNYSLVSSMIEEANEIIQNSINSIGAYREN